jgi:hypothetical protein
MNILITGVGGPTPRSIARSIKRHSKFYDAVLIGTDINPLAYGLYETELYDKTYLIPKVSERDYWKAIETIIKEHQIEIAIVQPELEVLEWSNRMGKNKLPCKVLLADNILVKLLVDKSKMTEVLAHTGLVPKSFVIDAVNPNYYKLENCLPYPFWIRATSGSSGLGSLKVVDKNALINWITINPDVKQFIASTFLPGRNLAVKMLYYNDKLLRTAVGERVNYIMASVAPSGITGNTSFGRLLNEPELVQKAIDAMEILFKTTAVKKQGFFTADFKEDEKGVPYITEINVRNVAFNLSFAKGGANFTEDTIRLLSEDPTFNHDYKMYEFEKDLIFLRDVDAEPILMKESELLK